MKLTKKRYLQGFVAVTLVLALVRQLLPVEPVITEPERDEPLASNLSPLPSKKHRIWSVPSYKTAFPDTNSVQLTAAMKWGVTPVANRADAEARKKELVYIASSPYYHVDKLRQSIPYLVPRAAVLLQDIGQAFFDSLYIKVYLCTALSSPACCVPRRM